jgi:hypothetical protein
MVQVRLREPGKARQSALGQLSVLDTRAKFSD